MGSISGANIGITGIRILDTLTILVKFKAIIKSNFFIGFFIQYNIKSFPLITFLYLLWIVVYNKFRSGPNTLKCKVFSINFITDNNFICNKLTRNNHIAFHSKRTITNQGTHNLNVINIFESNVTIDIYHQVAFIFRRSEILASDRITDHNFRMCFQIQALSKDTCNLLFRDWNNETTIILEINRAIIQVTSTTRACRTYIKKRSFVRIITYRERSTPCNATQSRNLNVRAIVRNNRRITLTSRCSHATSLDSITDYSSIWTAHTNRACQNFKILTTIGNAATNNNRAIKPSAITHWREILHCTYSTKRQQIDVCRITHCRFIEILWIVKTRAVTQFNTVGSPKLILRQVVPVVYIRAFATKRQRRNRGSSHRRNSPYQYQGGHFKTCFT